VNPEIEAHVRSLVNFPSPPGVAAHIIALARDPDIAMSKVARALSLDSSLSAKVLRIANSPLYAQRRGSENLRQALVVLGLNATLTLALSFSLVKCLRAGRPNGISHPLYWRRALLAGTSARALADALHHPMAEEIFLAALLQDVGILALDQAIPDLYRDGEMLQRDHTRLAAMEEARLQTDHARVGAWLMKSWNLPDRLHAAIGHSHRTDPSDADPNRIFERCVALSGPVADLFLLVREERRFTETAERAERCLGLDRRAFGQVVATVGAMIPETEALFDSESLAAQHPDLIIEQARDVLMLRSLGAMRDLATLRSHAVGVNSGAADPVDEGRLDPVTGVNDRAHLDQVLQREFDDSNRRQGPISIAFVNLKRVNGVDDGLGAPFSDHLLKAAAKILRGNTRDSDFIARYGAEEFMVVLPATGAATAGIVCARIEAAFGRPGEPLGAEGAAMNVTTGYATHGGETSFATLAEFVSAAGKSLAAGPGKSLAAGLSNSR
jgi:diguanylate cyclase (GGDEF)-like protein